jgi:peptidyl-prolyl cis-trans isomerase D
MLAVLLLLIVPPFAFFGIQGFERMVAGGTDLAEVDGTKVTALDFSRAQEQQREQLRSVLGPQFDASLLDTAPARKQILDSLIAQQIVTNYLARNRMLASDRQLREVITAEPSFEEGGKFSRALYQEFLRRQNESEGRFEERLRSDIAQRQLAIGLVESGIASSAVAQRLAALRFEQREVAEVTVSASQYAAQVKLDADAVEQYYQAHVRDFEAPESIRAEYVVLALDAYVAAEQVTADEVKAAYEATLAPRARDRAEARKKVDALLAELRKDPGKFGALAKAHSQDPGSAPQDGDLGWVSRGSLVKPFEDAAFKLKVNELSGIVPTEFGFHVIKVAEIRKAASGEERRVSHILIAAPPEVKDFAVARPEIERQLKQERATKKFPEVAVNFSNFADDQSDALQPVAEKFKLQVASTGWITRQTVPAPLNHPRLVQVLFGDDAIRSRRNTEAIETSPGRLVVARVVEHKAAAARPLEEVRGQIARKLTDEAALKLAIEAGAAQLKALQAGQAPALKWNPAKTISRENPAGLDPRAMGPVMRASGEKLPAYVGVELPPTGYAIYRVSKVTAAQAIDPAKLRAGQTGLARQDARETYEAFVASLRERADIRVNEGNLAKREQR